jgi:hypothetical protein
MQLIGSRLPEATLMPNPTPEFTAIPNTETVRSLYGSGRETMLENFVGNRPNKWSPDADVWVQKGIAVKREVYLTAATKLNRFHDVGTVRGHVSCLVL